MSGLLYLESDDFHIQQGQKGPLLCTQIPDISLILFYSTTCGYCHKVIPLFKQLPGTISGVYVGIVNVYKNQACIERSKNTIAPITFVPYIVLYHNGKPFMRYNGPYDLGEIRRFIFEVSEKLRARQTFHNTPNVKPAGQERGIPEFCIGRPKEDDVCYLEESIAYSSSGGLIQRSQ